MNGALSHATGLEMRFEEELAEVVSVGRGAAPVASDPAPSEKALTSPSSPIYSPDL